MRLRTALIGLTAAGLLTACGGSSDSAGGDDSDAKGEGATTTGGSGEQDEAAAVTPYQIAVPGGYDTDSGWQTLQDGLPLPLPATEAIALFSGASTANGAFTVLDAASGEVRWSSAPISSLDGEAQLSAFATTVGGDEYLVTWSTGAVGGDAINLAQDSVSIDVFAAEGSGEGVTPVRHVDVPGGGTVEDGGAGILVRLDDDTVVAVDPASGTTTTHDPEELPPPPDCGDCGHGNEILALTPEGPLTHNRFYGVFWVPGAWSSVDAAPGNADTEASAAAVPVTEDLLVGQWDTSDGENDVWAVLDSATGEIRATVDCPNAYLSEDSFAGRSANGRYLTQGQRVFDLTEGTGRCYEQSDQTSAVGFSALDDRGLAYGLANAPVQIAISTGEVTELSPDVNFPFADLAGYGVFEGTGEDGPRLVAYPHAG